MRSRQAFTTIRCIQVVTAASPRKEPGPAVRRDQAVLQPVGGVLGVAHRPQRHGPEPVAVPGEQLGEGVRVAVHVRAQQLGVGQVGHAAGVPSTATSATAPRKPPSTGGSAVSQTVT